MFTENFATIITLMNIPLDAVILLAIVPTIATVVSLGRHIFGFNSFNIYVPIVTSLVFIQMGLFSGIVISLLVFLTTIYTRKILISFRMHYYVRISFIYTIVSFLLFTLVIIMSYLYNTSYFPLSNILGETPLIPIILTVTLVEEFFTTVVKEGENKVFIMFLETLAISVIAFFILDSRFFKSLLVQNLWVLLLLFPLNILLARWEGLRFSEILRFKSVIVSEMKRIDEEEEGRKKKKKKKKKNRKFSTKSDDSNKKSKTSFIW